MSRSSRTHRTAAAVIATACLAWASSPVPPAGAADAARGRPTCEGKAATVVGTDRGERLVGTAGDDVIVGLGGADRIFGRGGDDLLCGGPGPDVLRGGTGADRLHGGGDESWHGKITTGDDLDGGRGSDHLDPGRDLRPVAGQGSPDLLRYSGQPAGIRADLSRSPGVVHTASGTDTIRLAEPVWIAGSDHDDAITGSARADMIDGSAGADEIRGGPGADLVDDNGGFFGIHTDHDPDAVAGGPGRDVLFADGGRDAIRGGSGDDALISNDYQPSGPLLGGAGDDEIDAPYDGQAGRSVDGGPGADTLTLDDLVALHRRATSLDAQAGTISSAKPGLEPEPMTGFEHYVLYSSGLLRFLGTDLSEFVDASQSDGALHAETLGGDDRVRGGREADVIDTGDGTDTVSAWLGDDVCRNAEHTRGCNHVE